MKIIFTSTGKDWDSTVDSVFGSAVGYILYHEEKDKLSWFSNSKNRNAGHRAGINAGQNLNCLGGAEDVIMGRDVGPKAADVLKNAGIIFFAGVGNKSVKEVFVAYNNDELKQL